ncbi:MAG: efflux RND transporter periplasmic adaptor subunit [Syntrophobacteraceae bacterium]
MKPAAKKAIYGVMTLLIAGAIVYAFLPKPLPVDAAIVKRGPIRVTVDEDGKTRVKERYVVSAPIAGRLLRVRHKEGDRVEAGKTIITSIEPTAPALLDARAVAEAEAKVRTARAAKEQALHELEQRRVEREYAETQLGRMKPLFAGKAVSRQNLDEAEEKERAAGEAVEAARFGLQVAGFELEQAEAALLTIRDYASGTGGGKTTRFDVRSPIDGVVLRLVQESEVSVAAGAELVEVGNPSEIEVVVDVLSDDGVRIKPGAKVILERWGGDDPLAARVRLVEPSAFTKVSALGVEEQRVNVIADLIDPIAKRSRLLDRYRVDARIVVAEAEDALKAPTGALFRQDGEWRLFAVEGGKAALHAVKVGMRNDAEAEILEGAPEGARVIVYPSDKIEDGVSVTPRTESQR